LEKNHGVNSNEALQVSIFDINGKLTYSKYFNNPRSIINTNMFPKGVYLIKISYTIDGEDKSVLKKIIKK